MSPKHKTFIKCPVQAEKNIYTGTSAKDLCTMHLCFKFFIYILFESRHAESNTAAAEVVWF